jgi:6-pyruvoyltetrahydropterin/6-carboxytetrahydropterin synthase
MKPVVDYLDHKMMNDIEPFTVLNPTAENIAKYFFDECNEGLKKTTEGRVKVKQVTIWETDTSIATYYE